jgi:hypothetical protein
LVPGPTIEPVMFHIVPLSGQFFESVIRRKPNIHRVPERSSGVSEHAVPRHGAAVHGEGRSYHPIAIARFGEVRLL